MVTAGDTDGDDVGDDDVGDDDAGGDDADDDGETSSEEWPVTVLMVSSLSDIQTRSLTWTAITDNTRPMVSIDAQRERMLALTLSIA